MPANLRAQTEIQAVFFDAAGTLIKLRESVGEGYARVARKHGWALYPKQTELAFRSIWKSMPPMGSPLGNAGDRSKKNWWRWLVHQVLDEVAPAMLEDYDEFFEDLFAEYAKPEVWEVFPEAIGVIEDLRARGLPLYVLSNFDSRLLPVLDGLGLRRFFTEVFYSGEIGHAKPSAEIFTHAVKKAAAPPAGCLHVGDDPIADWQGARAAGLQAFELDRCSQDLRAILDLKNLPDFSD